MFLLTLFGLGQAFVIERHAPALMVAQRTPAPTRIHAVGPMDPLFFENLFKERAVPIVIRATRIGPIEPRGMGEKPIIFRTHGGPLEDRASETTSYGHRLFRPRPKRTSDATHGSTGKETEDGKKELRGHSVIFYVFIIFLFIIVGLSGYQAGKAAESRNYVRLPSTN